MARARAGPGRAAGVSRPRAQQLRVPGNVHGAVLMRRRLILCLLALGVGLGLALRVWRPSPPRAAPDNPIRTEVPVADPAPAALEATFARTVVPLLQQYC